MVTAQEYFKIPALSQSKLKSLLIHPKLFNLEHEQELYFEEKKYFTIGSAVDCTLTQGQLAFEEQYHISNLKNKPSDAVKSIINQVFDLARINDGLEISEDFFKYQDLILNACDEQKYSITWKEKTRIDKILEQNEYWLDLHKSLGKQVLSQEENLLISEIVMSLRTNEATAEYFILPDRGLEHLYQLPILFIFEDLTCKALLDIVIINHIAKTIKVADLKTLSDYTKNFPQALRKYRYDIQASWYLTALLNWIAENRPELESYTILPFEFIVESTTMPGEPLVYTCAQEITTIGEFGREAGSIPIKNTNGDTVGFFDQKEIFGFRALINLYKYYVEHGFEKERIVKENNSKFVLNWNGIIS